VEREITQRQEEFLNNLPRLVHMRSDSLPGQASIDLEFEIGTDMDAAMLQISNQLDQVPSYPENALRPTIISSGSNARPVIWSQLRAVEGNPRPTRTYKKFAEDNIRPEFEKIPGVSEMRVYGGRDPELQVRFDPTRLSLYGISIGELIARIRAENVDISGGALTEGKREYTVRTLSRYRTAEDMQNLIVRSDERGTVYLKDLAT
jgi:HAE1 family hydrophobic/amphiphilic exporter-1